MAEEVAVGTLLNMLVAGEDTTAATAAWALHYLSINPVVQQKVRAESAQVLSNVGQPYDHAVLEWPTSRPAHCTNACPCRTSGRPSGSEAPRVCSGVPRR
ncbi:cytochrome P450 [Streptomyces sp. Qhu-G9]|uniref:cytochrome P450 n=1 Tax=Streptomyces sp. Qhu-G9 TaxID=3452799 RepID=UPI0022AC1035|nr:cytochrome P450 [Streptomyces aurantiacus]WAU86409.1 cytochrome P450 [Streptomyces aurantiacus]